MSAQSHTPTTHPAALAAQARRPLPEALRQALQARFAAGGQWSCAAAVCQQHGRDESPFDAAPPDGVVFCDSADDVADAVALAHAHGVPVIPFGIGSSLEGHVLAVHGGISLDCSRMNRIVRVHGDDLTCTVQPGVTREQLNAELRHHGLFFPVDPGANATLGGMAATRASGTNAVRYGTMKDNVLALQVAVAGGRLVRTGSRARKSSAGYDLTRLVIGSEGTLGVITELTLKLHPLPEAVSAAVCHFASVDAAVRTTIAIIQMGVPIARCELLDANAVRNVNAHDHLTLRETAMLLMEFHGSAAGVQEQAQTVQALAAEHGGSGFEWATTPEARTRLWTARHHAFFAGLAAHPGCRTVTTDTCVPISRLAECIALAVAQAAEAGLPHYIVGHVGDGNFHIAYLVKEGDAAQRALAERLNEQLVRHALALEGTCSGEHGIGLHKMGFLPLEAGDAAVDVMRQIKRALDPANLFNPGKIFTP